MKKIYLVQEWLYLGKNTQKIEKFFDNKEEAMVFYEERMHHLLEVSVNKKINDGFVRILKIKKSFINSGDLGPDECIKFIWHNGKVLV